MQWRRWSRRKVLPKRGHHRGGGNSELLSVDIKWRPANDCPQRVHQKIKVGHRVDGTGLNGSPRSKVYIMFVCDRWIRWIQDVVVAGAILSKSFASDRLRTSVLYTHIVLSSSWNFTVPGMDRRTICVRRSLTVKTIIVWMELGRQILAVGKSNLNKE